MVIRRRRKCLCCHKLFKPDPRQKKHQRYCSEFNCRKASKAARHKKWLCKAENKDYFSGPANVARVQAWRKAHPGYWRKSDHALVGLPLQDPSLAQVIDKKEESVHLTQQPLQDLINQQVPVLIGLIAHLTGETLQDQIANTTRRLLTLGAAILTNTTRQDDSSPGAFYEKQTHQSPTPTPHTQTI